MVILILEQCFSWQLVCVITDANVIRRVITKEIAITYYDQIICQNFHLYIIIILLVLLQEKL